MSRTDKIVNAMLNKDKKSSLESLLSTVTGFTQSIEGDGNQQIAHQEVTSQSIKGNHNVQTSGSVNITSQIVKPVYAPPPNSIAANSALKIRIETLIDEIKSKQYKHHGNNYKWAALNGQLAAKFGFTPKRWQLIYQMDEHRAFEVISFLQEILNNTIDGRIKKTASKSGYQHTKQHCFRLEKDYLLQLGWTESHSKKQREIFTNCSSRKDISTPLFNQWIDYLKKLCDQIYDE